MNAFDAHDRVLQRAYLFDDPDAYRAGVNAAFEAVGSANAALDSATVVVEEPPLR